MMRKKKDYTCNYYSEYFEILIMTINSITVLAINTEHTRAAPPVQSDDMILFGSSLNVIHGSLILIF